MLPFPYIEVACDASHKSFCVCWLCLTIVQPSTHRLVLKVGFDPDNLVFNEDEGEVTIDAVILSPNVAMNVIAVFNIFAEPGTATSKTPSFFKVLLIFSLSPLSLLCSPSLPSSFLPPNKTLKIIGQ